jgi:hypothetical protein
MFPRAELRRAFIVAAGLIGALWFSKPVRAEKPAAAKPSEVKPAANESDDWETPHYDKGFVLVSSRESAPVPFRLVLNHVSQFKYTNTLATNETYTDHFGNEKPVLRRNDIQLTRDVFYFNGYAFDRRLDFQLMIYMSSATLSATAAGYVGFKFSKAFALRVGFFSLPSLRSMTGTYPFFAGTDRSMETNYMRPGFTQGIWAEGEPVPGFRYLAMLGNSLNSLDVTASRIDKNFAYSATFWYDHNDFGKPWNDYEDHDAPALRVGTAFTYAREDRISDLSTASPENNSIFISDGSLLFATGALAPDVTIRLANYFLWAADAGIKYRGLAFNFELTQRWLTDFDADGRLPIDSMHDWGFEASLGYFAIRQRLELYARTSYVHGPFATPFEVGGGFNWYPLETRQVWLNVEAMDVQDSPYGGVLYAYSAGQTGFVLQSQFLLRF